MVKLNKDFYSIGKETKLFRLKEKLNSTVFKYSEFGVLVAFIVVFLFFLLFANRFATLANFRTVLMVTTELGIMTIGVTFLMVAGEFDLSVGSVFGFSILICTILANTGLNSILAFIITIIITSSIGFINGLITLRASIPSFIVTLGMQMFIRGIMLSVSSGFLISYTGDNLIPMILGREIKSFINHSTLILFALLMLFSIILNKTRLGNWILATGADKESARQVGVNIYKTKMICFIIAGIMAGFAGMVNLSRFKIADVLMGQGMELEAIAATVIGGTLLTGGRGSIIGAFLGVLITGMIRSGLILLGAPTFWYRSFIGLILVIVAIINSYMMKIKRKR